ncbi:MAG: sensor histidine kinase, partial [Betaproteobacteria bacterium]
MSGDRTAASGSRTSVGKETGRAGGTALRGAAGTGAGAPERAPLRPWREGRMTPRALYLVLAATFVALGVAALQTYRAVESELTDAALARRSAIAQLAAATLSARFERVIDLSVSLATRVRFREHVAAGRWTEAAAILSQVPWDFPYVERLFLTDTRGTLEADVPELPGVQGRNFAYREWYAGVSQNWQPYISPVYQRAAVPQRNVFAVAVPVRAGGDRVAGILVVQVDLAAFFDWTRAVDLGPGGLLYVVDGRRQLAFHPGRPVPAEVRSLAGNPFIESLLRNEAGVVVGPSPVDAAVVVSAFVPATQGWGVVAQQPAEFVFAARDNQLRRVVIGFGVIVVLGALLAYLALHLVVRRREAEGDRRVKLELERRVEERTRQLEAAGRALSDLYDNAPCGYHSVDAEGRFVRINDTWLSWLGYRREEVIGKLRHPDIMTPASAARFRAECFPLFKRQGWLKGVEFEYVRKDGSTFPASLSATTIYDAAGNYLSSRSTVFDISERKRIEAEVHALNARLETANQELESFSYSVSHDLRAPLRAVDGYALMLEEDYGTRLDDEGRRLLAVVRSESKRMGHLIDDLLAFARTGSQRIDLVAVDMAGLARETAAEAAREQPAARIEFDELPAVHGDRALLRQVWVNLIGNALKYSSKVAAPRIEVGGRANGTEC